MLTLFPSLLFYKFFAPTILRVAASGVIIALAYEHFLKRTDIEKLLTPLVGKLASPATWLWVLIEAAVAVALLVGFYTQAAAIVGIILAIKSLIMRPRALVPFGHVADWLLLVICLSLLLTGAGAFAFDLPL